MTTSRVLSHASAVRGATRHFLRRGTIDMDALARELAVSRATLYRIVRSRDALLGEVLSGVGRCLVDDALATDVPAGVDGVIEVSRRFAASLAQAEPLRWFSKHEPEAAHRVLLGSTGRVHGVTVDVQRDLIARVGAVDDALTDRTIVYVSVLESVLYGPLLGDRGPDFEVAEPALRALLR